LKNDGENIRIVSFSSYIVLAPLQLKRHGKFRIKSFGKESSEASLLLVERL
jgi:hypothetical protein